jgi:starch-binding outer membrane protein, SusD/RagB family
MNNKIIKPRIIKIAFFLVLFVFLSPGCHHDFLDEYPKISISEQIYWQTEDDAYQALVGVYALLRSGWGERLEGYGKQFCWASAFAGYGSWRNFGHSRGLVLEPGGAIHLIMWRLSYQIISRANYFLENINKVNIDESKRNVMIAEVRFIRAFMHFWLNQWYGSVPVVTTVLTFDEANSIMQSSEQDVRSFILAELTEIAPVLPLAHPASEKGRIERGAALALKGRVLLYEERWPEAVEVYSQIMNLGRYIIDPRWKELFQVQGDDNDEAIFVVKYHESEQGGEAMSQHTMRSSLYGGFNALNVFKHFVDNFRMIDGELINDSPLYDPGNPYNNRDPRLYKTLLIADYSVVPIDGEVFRGDPATIARIGQTGTNISGYLLQKWWDWQYVGNRRTYGGDYMQIRYAEVLLSRLEAELEAGNSISQDLLDNTINRIRQRPEIDMPPVTETDPAKLREIIRNERFVELAFEGGIRYFDLRRWRTLETEVGIEVLGMRMTNDPASYEGLHHINEDGYLIIGSLVFEPHNYYWPIPLSELDVNKNLVQNPGYY